MATLQWQTPEYSMHGDRVELIAPFDGYLFEIGPAYPMGGSYILSCCLHDMPGATCLWEKSFRTKEVAQAYAEGYADGHAHGDDEGYGRAIAEAEGL